MCFEAGTAASLSDLTVISRDSSEIFLSTAYLEFVRDRRVALEY